MDRFDIAEGWFCYLTDYSGGQSSKEYKRLCRMQEWFTPRPSLRTRTLSHDGATVYAKLVAKRYGYNGYTACRCRDCMETSMDGDFCHECSEAECTLESECLASEQRLDE